MQAIRIPGSSPAGSGSNIDPTLKRDPVQTGGDGCVADGVYPSDRVAELMST